MAYRGVLMEKLLYHNENITQSQYLRKDVKQHTKKKQSLKINCSTCMRIYIGRIRRLRPLRLRKSQLATTPLLFLNNSNDNNQDDSSGWIPYSERH